MYSEILPFAIFKFDGFTTVSEVNTVKPGLGGIDHGRGCQLPPPEDVEFLEWKQVTGRVYGIGGGDIDGRVSVGLGVFIMDPNTGPILPFIHDFERVSSFSCTSDLDVAVLIKGCYPASFDPADFSTGPDLHTILDDCTRQSNGINDRIHAYSPHTQWFQRPGTTPST